MSAMDVNECINTCLGIYLLCGGGVCLEDPLGHLLLSFVFVIVYMISEVLPGVET